MRPQGKAYFLRIPAPKELASCPRTCHRRQEARHRPSLIRGTTVTDPDSLLSYEAKWMWTANGHEPQIFYGAVVLCYPTQRFWITCRIRGQAACFPFRYTFSDESFERRRFALEQPPAALAVWRKDIEDQMNQLDAKMAMLNTGDYLESWQSLPNQRREPDPATVSERHFAGDYQSHNDLFVGNSFHGTVNFMAPAASSTSSLRAS
ncbi:hypothetical protein LTR70_003547 [Exophiala xenobiotica]|uniref:Uncharacterized protein n=1 Tax=Lithohypha guttulata TaxID=1690604 RepID=A0ABR0KGX0_9EURO|nr:hypothetical protein LTR24_003095 [Lithohypha guttulata]KAK5322926.1 hypothetical protein LTR70_003547 [Exophiala xenobiotica]